eukprot:NP_496591.2 Uncharacterized protein CELE_Y57A10A.14 [Caenorhabditis elegans]
MLVHQGFVTLDSNSSRINIFDVFDNSPTSSSLSDSDPSLLIEEEEPPNPKKRAELYQWLNTSYYGSIIRKVSAQVPYQPDYVRIEDNSTIPIFDNEEDYNEIVGGAEGNSLLNEHKIQIDLQPSSTGSRRSTESYELCKSCTSRYTRHRTTYHARIIWLILTTVALSSSFFPYGLFSVVLLLFIPPQIRRPICKKCRTSSFWGF